MRKTIARVMADPVVWVAVSFLLAVGMVLALSEWVKVSHPGGSKSHLGLLAILQGTAAIVLAVVAMRRRRSVVVWSIGLLSIAIVGSPVVFFCVALLVGQP